MNAGTQVNDIIGLIGAKSQEIENIAAPSFERFYDFVKRHKPNTGYVAGSPRYELQIFERFRFAEEHFWFAKDTASKGLPYVAPLYDGTQMIVMPYGYLQDPDEWERQTLDLIENHRQASRKAFREHFGENAEDTIKSVDYHLDPENDVELLIITASDNDAEAIKSKNNPNLTHRSVLDLETGSLYPLTKHTAWGSIDNTVDQVINGSIRPFKKVIV